jgi:hypothetical protein
MTSINMQFIVHFIRYYFSNRREIFIKESHIICWSLFTLTFIFGVWISSCVHFFPVIDLKIFRYPDLSATSKCHRSDFLIPKAELTRLSFRSVLPACKLMLETLRPSFLISTGCSVDTGFGGVRGLRWQHVTLHSCTRGCYDKDFKPILVFFMPRYRRPVLDRPLNISYVTSTPASVLLLVSDAFYSVMFHPLIYFVNFSVRTICGVQTSELVNS